MVAIVSGALNNAAAKKYDLEAWFPFQCEYKELVSCSNCTDYQSRSLDIRSGTKPVSFSSWSTKWRQLTDVFQAADGSRKFVHMLNSTLTATERALCCLVENYQTEDGLVIPEALRPYMGGKSFVPFTRQAPSWETKGQVVSKKANVAKVTDGVKDMSV